jgi:hypothetical protein
MKRMLLILVLMFCSCATLKEEIKKPLTPEEEWELKWNFFNDSKDSIANYYHIKIECNRIE